MATIDISLNVGNDMTAAEARNAWAKEYNYQANIPDEANPGQTIPNPESKADFMVRMMKRLTRQMHKRHRRLDAITAAENALTPMGDE